MKNTLINKVIKNKIIITLFVSIFCAPLYTKSPAKKWTIIVYMAADNDLRGFAARNIKQMAAIGSNDFINIAVHLDIRISGNKKITRRYYIENNKIYHVNANDTATQKMDSGDPKTLISCCNWAINEYPADHYALFFWNHGTGPLDPASGRIINPTELFVFNPTINKFEIDRTIDFIDYFSQRNKNDKGICWDDTTGHYLTNQKLEIALSEINKNTLKGKKFSIIGFDACLMATLEIASAVKDYADLLVASEEVELGTGWNYQRVFSPFSQSNLDPVAFASHIVNAYHRTYNTIVNDYTLSVMDLSVVNQLENNINIVAELLIQCLINQKNKTVKQALRTARAKKVCTHFDEPSYLDLHHLYVNILARLKDFHFNDVTAGTKLNNELDSALRIGMELIKKIVVANTTGKSMRRAEGISIYFPERKLHYSYKKTNFCKTNSWLSFLNHYLAS